MSVLLNFRLIGEVLWKALHQCFWNQPEISDDTHFVEICGEQSGNPVIQLGKGLS